MVSRNWSKRSSDGNNSLPLPEIRDHPAATDGTAVSVRIERKVGNILFL
jgi:hypothetical protein